MKKVWTKANCYGYALNRNRWHLTNGLSYEEMPEELLSLNPNWKQVRRDEMVLGKSYVAYRYGYVDFHFMVRDEKGHWTHKPGSSKVRTISQKDVFKGHWKNDDAGAIYTSKVFLYEVPNR
jgi:hypothetical protein